jgi:hypothetical protein
MRLLGVVLVIFCIARAGAQCAAGQYLTCVSSTTWHATPFYGLCPTYAWGYRNPATTFLTANNDYCVEDGACPNCCECSNKCSTPSPSCQSCPANTYSGIGASTCTACAAGKTSVAGASVCRTARVTGKYVVGVGCIDCEAGKYSVNLDSPSCVGCLPGTYSTTMRATSASACVPCPADTYSNVTHGSGGRCAHCPPRHSSLPGSLNISACGCSPGMTAMPAAEFCPGAKIVQLERSCGGPCTATQKYTPVVNGVSQDASFAVDGIRDGVSPNQARSGYMHPINDQWWRLDLGRPVKVSSLKIWQYKRETPTGPSIGTYMRPELRISVWVGNGETHNLNRLCAGSTSDTLEYRCNDNPPVFGRYVHVVSNANTYSDFVLVEVEVFGCDMCTECFGGTYKSEPGTNACTNCPAGTHGLRILAANSSSHCTNCVAGKYNDRVAMDHIDNCLVCPAGQTSLAGASVCRTACVAGKYVVGAGCTDCEAGKFSVNLDSPSCAGCLPGTYSTTVRATSASVCLMCPSNTFSSGNASACQPCQANALSVAGSVGQEFCYCRPGYAHAADALTCRICDQGTWNSQLGRTACSNCSLGLYSATFGAVGNETCLPCPLGQWSPEGSANCNLCPVNSRAPASSGLLSSCVCNAGYFGPNGGPCTACMTGTFSGEVGVTNASACVLCPGGTYSSTAGASACASCPTPRTFSLPGTITEAGCGCATNNYFGNVNTCVDNPEGWYGWSPYGGHRLVYCHQFLSGGTIGPDKCTTFTMNVACSNCQCACGTACGANYIQPSCVACPVNTNSLMLSSGIDACMCNAGYTGAGGSSCIACAAGKFKNSSGSAICTNCLAGAYSGVTGATSASVCEPCPAGAFSGAGSGVCVNCLAGTYASAGGASACVPCPVGTHSNVSGASSSAVCVSCPAGAFSGVSGATNASTCVPCPAGTYSLAGASACVLCPVGSSSSTPGSTSITNCACNAGFYGANGGPCTACASTFTSLPGSLSVTDCGCAENFYSAYSTMSNTERTCGITKNQVCSSSQSNDCNGDKASYAIDTDSNTFTCAEWRTLNGDQETWWRVDLETSRIISKLAISLRNGQGYVVQIGDIDNLDANRFCFIGKCADWGWMGHSCFVDTFCNKACDTLNMNSQYSQETGACKSTSTSPNEQKPITGTAVRPQGQSAPGQHADARRVGAKILPYVWVPREEHAVAGRPRRNTHRRARSPAVCQAGDLQKHLYTR